MLYKSYQVCRVFIAKLIIHHWLRVPYIFPVEQWDAMVSLPQNYNVPYQMATISYLQFICESYW